MTRPLILISNDDGYAAKGINDLIDMVHDLGDVIVVAPEGPRSGASLSITCHDPVRIKLISEQPGVSIYSCTGTPCDCVKIAFEKVLPHTPDIILGGINHGDNASINAHYSGTMAVAIEGALKQVPSIGISSCKVAWDADFSAMKPYVHRIVKEVMANGLPDHVCLNVNFPDCESFRGMKVCRMGYGEWLNEWEGHNDPRGREYFWLTGNYVGHDADDPSTDSWAIRNGFIAITPTQLDLTAYNTMEGMRKLFEA